MGRLLERCPVLGEMMATKSARTASGTPVPMHSNIPPAYAEALYETVRAANPALVLEVGMAFGVSSLAILSALRDGEREGRLISVDPSQSSVYQGCGLAAIERAGLADRHRLIEDFDYNALPRLLSEGVEVEFAYIDGWHTFDYALVDWWYVDKMLAAGGIVGFNDCGFPAVARVIRFVLSHRRYDEIEVGLPFTVGGGYHRWFRLLKPLAFGGKETWFLRREDRYLRKRERWEPSWDFFARF